jgi:hypothetical protein
MHGPLGWSVLGALGFWFMGLGVARAQDSGAARPSRQYDSGRAVDVTVVAGGEDVKDLVNTVREVVGRLGLQVRAQVAQEAVPETGESAATRRLARAEINLLAPDAVQVVVYGRGGQVVLQQRFGRNVSAPVLREEVADAVRSAVEAQLLIDPERATAPAPTTSAPTRARAVDTAAGPASPFSVAEPPVAEPPALAPPAVVSVAPVQPPPSEAPARPVASWARPLALDLTALAGVGAFAKRSGVVTRLGGAVTISFRNWLNPSLILAGEYLVPFQAGFDNIAARANASVTSVRVVPAIQVFHTRNIAIDVGAGAGIDVIDVQLKPPQSPAYLSVNGTPPTRTDPVLRALASAHMGLASRIALSLDVACDVDVAAQVPDYVVEEGGTRYHLLNLGPWRVRPLVLVGLTLAALGESRLASGVFR